MTISGAPRWAGLPNYLLKDKLSNISLHLIFIISRLSIDEASIKKMRDRANSNLTSIVNSFSDHLRKFVLLLRMERLDSVFKDFDHYDAMLPEEQWEIEEFE
ncbi:hypothetical protein NPIL_246861 [Nephila pilipes]|uniref:Uncharacterized protein n=1 Tax=Nephila pilipes TaxID=299642 RepID=A0A8X6N4V0_NEPPI|nr:hypothetical protein NPIL_246861 [Nephila pilipes]